MSDAKWTPGPWSLTEQRCEGERTILIRRHWGGEFEPGAEGSDTYGSCLGAHIADIKHQGDDAPVVTRAQALANAHLIAAAPELFAELEEAREVIQALIDEGYAGFVGQRGRIDRALSKARGEQ